MKLSVIGTGYLGAIHATCMAHLGHEVTAFDVDENKIAMLASGMSPFYEPGFNEFLTATLESGRLRFTTSAGEAVRGATLHFICVGTPQRADTDAADMRYVESAFQSILANVDTPGVIVGKSTVPVGTAEVLSDIAVRESTEHHLEVAWNPEFLREGTAIEDTLHPDRLVFGVSSEHAEQVLIEAYSDLINADVPYVTTDLATSEMVKVAANSFLATKISFMNAMAEVCEVVNADVTTLSKALGYDTRIGHRYLNAGLGFGGGCLPKDIRAFSARAGELGASDALTFLREIDKINMRRRDKTVSMVGALLGGDYLSKNIAVLGAAFKPNSDDVRDSPALSVAAAIHLKGAHVRVHDPKAMENARGRFPTLTYCSSWEDACRGADLVLLATEWDEYRNIDPATLAALVREPIMLDARNALDQSIWTQAGWHVRGLGRRNLKPSKG